MGNTPFVARYQNLSDIQKKVLSHILWEKSATSVREAFDLLNPRHWALNAPPPEFSLAETTSAMKSLAEAAFITQLEKRKGFYEVSQTTYHELLRYAASQPELREAFDGMVKSKLDPFSLWNESGYKRHISAILWSLLTGKLEQAETCLVALLRADHGALWDKLRPLHHMFFSPLDADTLLALTPVARNWVLTHELKERVIHLEQAEDLAGFLKEQLRRQPPSANAGLLLADYCLFQGDWKLFANTEDPAGGTAEAVAAQLAARTLQGAQAYDTGEWDGLLKVLRKEPGKAGSFFAHAGGLMWLIQLVSQRDSSRLKRFITLHKIGIRSNLWGSLIPGMAVVANHYEGKTDVYQYLNELSSPNRGMAAGMELWKILVLNWCEEPKAAVFDKKLIELAEKAVAAGWRWFAVEAFAVLAGRNPSYASSYHAVCTSTGYKSLFGVQQVQETWQKTLQSLRLIAERSSSETSKESRLVWFVDFMGLDIQPKEQVKTAKGWTAGKAVSLKRLAEGEVDFLTPQDERIAGTLRRQGGYYNSYMFDKSLAFPALVGHPLLFMGAEGIPLELVRDTISLTIDKRKDGSFEIGFSIEVTTAGFMIVKETPTRYKYIEVEESHVRLQQQIGGRSLRVPAAGKDLLAEVAGKLSGLVNVQSALGTETGDIPTVTADDRIHVHIVPQGLGFRLETLVKPFKTDPPFAKPGQGREHIMAEVKGKRMQAVRDLKKEKKNEQALLQASEILRLGADGSHEWLLDDPEDCLQVLMDIETLGDSLVVEWPEGQKLKIASRLSLSQLTVRVRKGKDWFEASGELKLDTGAVMNLLELMRLLEASPGRFIQLSSGEFLALTGEFRKRIEEMRAWSEEAKDHLRVHPLAAPAWEEAAGAAGEFVTDKSWRDRIKLLQEARQIKAKVPSTFQADMRSYQEEGFRWLAQLAHWGVGACLADDMGLGKTIQALALLLYRSDNGPSLVVAPPTVARNWVSEARKFAPTLNPILYAGKDRALTLRELGPFDVLITSYGLLQNDIEELGAVQWNVAILDEAQSIKNFQAKRSKAAMELQAEFKMITTGTPIENHLGELWNLFNFINPGFLGSLKTFNEKYAIPIEKSQDKDRRRQLQKLIQPFILRRRKNQVLDELPEKTEITLSVEFSPEEAAMYEALRIKALEKLTTLQGKTGEKHLQILAEIMRLRQFCCHPRLIDKDSTLSGAKLAVLEEIVSDLQENNHKALIFSQFVGNLAIVREWAEARKIPYQYLDGSTPQKHRELAIKQFQAGTGDLFLISLKAGGVGLNLTAADYVIHLDPWWNPAVEDQASDRAHRIGQERPVTIYRLVTKGTIEEKIVQLHHDKRDLADSLLEGTDASGKLSADALLKLLSEM